jgi:hypothetical protein
MAERYPTFRAGQRATGSLLASMQTSTVRKVSDTARTSDVNSDDPELQFTAEANAVYTMVMCIFAITAADADDINIAFTVPTGSDGTWSAIGQAVGATGDSADARINGQAFVGGSTERGISSQSSAQPTVIHIHGTLIVGGTAGTVALSWAVGTTPATTTVMADSYFAFTRIA